jgi:hypothetical protein
MKTTSHTFIASESKLASRVITWADKHRKPRKGHSICFSIHGNAVCVDITMPEAEKLHALANLKRILG